MLKILPLSRLVKKKVAGHGLTRKFAKQCRLLERDPSYPSLKVELLEPRQYGVYSFRIDRKYRALFVFRPDKQGIEILNITVHYH